MSIDTRHDAQNPPAALDPFRIGYRYVRSVGPDGRENSVMVPLTEEDFLHPQEGDRFMTNELHMETMTYLRDSGAIEAAADQIALLFTDHAHPMSAKADNFAGYSQLEIVAHRNGGTGMVPMHFVGQYQQISDWNLPIPVRPTGGKTSRGMD